MAGTITTGSILIEKHVPLPKAIELHSEPDSNGWLTLNGARPAFEKEIQDAGWTFFFMAGAIKATVFGFNPQKAMRVALGRLIGNVKSRHCNALEISQVSLRSFLKFPYVSVSANARHLQRGLTFEGQIFSGKN